VSEILPIIGRIARQAGNVLREGYGKVQHIQHKGAIDLVTEFDKRSEEMILPSIQKEFPGHAILAEESGHHYSDSEYQWVIDPLDGTTNFAHGIPIFSVSIALLKMDSPVAGVVYDPLRDELFLAEAGRRATLNDQPIKVSTRVELGQAILSTGFPYDIQTNPQNNFPQFVHLQRRTRAVRHLGSAALDCAWTAMGRLDGYWEFGVKAWDVGAGALIVREAGGRVTTVEGDENFLSTNSIVVSNGLLHEQLLRRLSEAALLQQAREKS